MIFTSMKNRKLIEAFGDPIGSYAGITAVGAHDLGEPCHKCSMMPDVEFDCGCNSEEEVCEGCGMPVEQCACGGGDVCPRCGQMSLEPGAPCTCGLQESKGPSKKTAKKILKGAVTATQKAQQVDSWATNPWAAANWMSQKAGVPLHGKKKKAKKKG